jgi:hypothetical protein
LDVGDVLEKGSDLGVFRIDGGFEDVDVVDS